jgi:hypothetical protein
LKPELENIAVTSELLTDDGRIKIMNYIKYLLFNNGPLATTGCDRGAFVNTRGKDLILACTCTYYPCRLGFVIWVGDLRQYRVT